MANSVKRSEKGKKLYAKYRSDNRREKNRGRITHGHDAPKCQNCYETQGPFSRSSVGTSTMPIVLIGCAPGLLVTSGSKSWYEGTKFCNERREMIDRKRYPQVQA